MASSSLRSLALVALMAPALSGCPRQAPCPPHLVLRGPQVPVPVPVPVAAPKKAPRSKGAPVAVLPIERSGMFRDERATLRGVLHQRAQAILKGRDVLPLTTVDDATAPKTAGGKTCAYADAWRADRARDRGWHSTSLMVVHHAKKPSELWVRLRGRSGKQTTLVAPWDRALGTFEQHRRALAQLVDKGDGLAVLGGLSGSGRKDAVAAGSVSVCEGNGWRCEPKATQAWKDALKAMSACYTVDRQRDVLLIEPSGSAGRCELEASRGRPAGPREACLCKAARASAAWTVRGGRRRVHIEHEATDIAGKPRPRVRLLDVSTNMPTHVGVGRGPAGSARQLESGDFDAIAVSLARCTLPKGSVEARLKVGADGRVNGVELGGARLRRKAAGCVRKALQRAAFTCTTNGKSASATLLIRPPEKAPKKR